MNVGDVRAPAGRHARRLRLDRPGNLLLIALTPFLLAVLATFALLLLVGEAVPRQLEPGSSLALPGIATASLAFLVALALVHARRRDPLGRKAGFVVAGFAALFSWPVWTMGVLPTVNGAALSEQNTTVMRLGRVELTRYRHGIPRYWAHLQSLDDDGRLRTGRYVARADEHARLASRGTGAVRVRHAQGLLGAEVVIGMD